MTYLLELSICIGAGAKTLLKKNSEESLSPSHLVYTYLLLHAQYLEVYNYISTYDYFKTLYRINLSWPTTAYRQLTFPCYY